MSIYNWLFLLFVPSFCFGQSNLPKTVVLIDVNLMVNRALFDRLDPNFVNTHLAVFERQFEQTSVNSLYENLKELKSIYLSPVDTLKGLIAYNNNDLPDPLSAKAAIKKLTKKAFQADQYLQLNIGCQVEGDVIGTAQLLKRIKPKLEVIISLFDKKRTLLQKVVARTAAKDFIEATHFGERDFSKKNKKHIQQLNEFLEPLLESTIHRAVEKIVII